MRRSTLKAIVLALDAIAHDPKNGQFASGGGSSGGSAKPTKAEKEAKVSAGATKGLHRVITKTGASRSEAAAKLKENKDFHAKMFPNTSHAVRNAGAKRMTSGELQTYGAMRARGDPKGFPAKDSSPIAEIVSVLEKLAACRQARDGGPGSGPHPGGGGSSGGKRELSEYVKTRGTKGLTAHEKIQGRYLNKEGKPNVQVAKNGSHLINGSYRDEMQYHSNEHAAAARLTKRSAEFSKNPAHKAAALKEAEHHEGLAKSYQDSANKAKF